IAVQAGRILGYGTADDVAAFGPADTDTRFKGKVVLPGFVEGHSHLFEGLTWQDPYLGFFDRRGPDGHLWPGLRNIEAVVQRLEEVERGMADPDAPLTAWGFDPIYFDGRRMVRADLDRVSTRRPVVITHASGHIMNVNGVVLNRAELTRSTDLDGLVRDAAGEPSGELLGPEAMGRVRRTVGGTSMERAIDPPALRRFGSIAQLAGVTTAADLLNELAPPTVAIYEQVTGEPGFPLRIVPALGARFYGVEAGIARWRELRQRGNDKLHFGLVKLVVDGSIQGFTARLRWPGYHNGAPNGMWYVAPAELAGIVAAYHDAGAQLHIHTNGDEASEVAVEMIGRALQATPRPDHRHTLQHCQMPDEALYRRIKTLGICCNIFTNHIFYWGDAHVALTMGPSRAARMDSCGTALRLGVDFAIHSDAPVTPLAPLFTAWCAVNRRTAAGRVLGDAERIPVAAALRAITLGAAYTLRLDHLVGSIDVGKFADFAVLDEDPLEADPAALKDIRVHATVVGGDVFPSPS
ncbi:MAG: amidohydrolase, partial [Pseudomonadota bacterium]|nr:amidohydrolase [Pseudomonadota bacterium]